MNKNIMCLKTKDRKIGKNQKVCELLTIKMVGFRG